MKKHPIFQNRSRLLILIVFTLFVVSIFIFASFKHFRIGFPLDDAWIHQTFARNLVRYGEWSFIPGKPTSGSTSPLWTILLAIGYFINISHIFWAFLVGGVCLFLIGWLGEKVFQFITDHAQFKIPWVGMLLIGEWHFIWAALSGMETVLMSVLVVLVFLFLAQNKIHWFWTGMLIGIGVWIRPDAVMLLAPLGFLSVISLLSHHADFHPFIKSLFGFLIPFLLYLLFNYQLAGTWWPNTFYAKQVEYISLLQVPFYLRFYEILKQPLIGAGILLLPGLIYRIRNAILSREWAILSMFMWWLGFSLVYALRLPVIYQHGRYLIPSMTIYFLIAGSGFLKLINQITDSNFIGRTLKRVWTATFLVVWLVFVGLGAKAYSEDVAIVESEMVMTSQWISSHTDSNALIAAHDIGALGYFGGRDILDLAGLISPEVIPMIRNETELAKYISKQKASYLMTFPGWYPSLVKGLPSVYKSISEFSINAGGENMAIFELQKE
jgi:hypothetical protein